MDDPLIGLTIYDSTQAQSVGASASTSTTRKQSKRFWKGGGDDTSEECFPCLPGISEDQHVEPVKQESESQKLVSSHPNAAPKLTVLESPALEEEEHEPEQKRQQLSKPNNYWLMRLFESSLFTMSIGVSYLFKSKDLDVLSYLGGKLFQFEEEDVDFYLPQLINMYIHMDGLSEVLHKYFLFRCRNSTLFSLKTAWMLRAYVRDSWLPSEEQQRGAKLLYLIMNEQIRPPRLPDSASMRRVASVGQPSMSGNHLLLRVPLGHQRSHSSGQSCLPSSYSSSHLSTLDKRRSESSVSLPGTLQSGRAFDTGCVCVINTAVEGGASPRHCECSAPRLSAQHAFMKNLGSICYKLMKHSTKELKTTQLYAELSQLNLNLPARVCVPLFDSKHQILRIPSSEAVVLNSKSKAPYMIVIEVEECADTYLSPLSPKLLDINITTGKISSSVIKSEGDSPCSRRASSMLSLYALTGALSDAHAMGSDEAVQPGMETSEEEEVCAPLSMKHKMLPSGSEEPSPSEGDDMYEANGVLNTGVGQEVEHFCVADVRRRLTDHLNTPKRMFRRDPEDPSASAMKEPWEVKVNRIRKSSPYGLLPKWKLVSAIVKWGDDLRQEVLCSQLLSQFKVVWDVEQVQLWVKPYNLLVIGSEGGLIEPIVNAISLHQIKKQKQGRSLLQYFMEEFGELNSEKFLSSQKCFVQSCAAYCLICYFTQVKDRHNGNILLDSDGHIIHIDFGFILACSPGNNLGFESSPFKLTNEFVEVMGGVNSGMYGYFKTLMLKGFMAARKHMDKFIQIVEIMQTGSQLPCFGHGPSTVQQLRARFRMNLTEPQLEGVVNTMIDSSVRSLTTKLYDQFQYITNGIL